MKPAGQLFLEAEHEQREEPAQTAQPTGRSRCQRRSGNYSGTKRTPRRCPDLFAAMPSAPSVTVIMCGMHSSAAIAARSAGKPAVRRPPTQSATHHRQPHRGGDDDKPAVQGPAIS